MYIKRTKVPIILDEGTFKGAIAYTAYKQSPRHRPDNLDKVISTIDTVISTKFSTLNSNPLFKYIQFSNEEDLILFISDTLMNIPEFIEWNLSFLEKEQGVRIDDPNRSIITFNSGLEEKTEDSWKDEFIDLDNFIKETCKIILNSNN